MPEKNAKKCNFDRKNPVKLSFSIHVHFVENNFMILGGFATTFPNDMKPSNHIFPPPPPPPKKQQWQQQQWGKESEKSRDDRKSEK